MFTVLQPPGWAKPRGYANGIAADGVSIFVAGQIAWDANAQIVSDDFALQVRQALMNIVDVLAQAGARPEHIVRMTWYVTSKRAYLDAGRAVGAHYRDIIGRHFPAMTAVEVTSLMEDRAQVEIEVTAMMPATSPLSVGDIR